jgi:hypothetical protein
LGAKALNPGGVARALPKASAENCYTITLLLPRAYHFSFAGQPNLNSEIGRGPGI